MATAQDIIDSATLRLGRRPAGTTFSSHDSSLNAELFISLQDLISSLVADNSLHIPTPSSVSDSLDLYEEQIRALKLLAAGDFISILRVREVSPVLMKAISEAQDALDTDNNISLDVDLGLPGCFYGYNVTTDS